MRATLLLCDGVQVLDGKFYVLGWGWTYIGPAPSPQALAIRIDLDWDDIGKPHHVEVFLEDEEGQPVVVENADGTKQTIEIQHDFEVPRLPELPEGTAVMVPLPLSLPPLPLPAGAGYRWRLMIDGETDDLWQASFTVRAAAPGAAAAG